MERLDLFVSGAVDRAALTYTLDLFGECTRARFAWRLRPAEESAGADAPGVWYGRPAPEGAPGTVEIPLRPPRGFRAAALDLPAPLSEAAGGAVLVYADTRAETGPPARVDVHGRRVAFGFDLFATAFAFAACLEERAHEAAHGPVHGYARRLTRGERRFERPWVEALFAAFARAISLAAGRDDLFGASAPRPLLLGHDVDAVDKRFVKSAKGAAFGLRNAGRAAVRGRPGEAARCALGAACLPFARADYFQFDRIRRVEERAGVRSTFYVYARAPGRSFFGRLRRLVFDPDYDLRREARLVAKLRELLAAGWGVGLHPSFDAFEDAERLAGEKRLLEQALDASVTKVRNHWLRLSLARTWRAQAEAGFEEDATLGFNDAVGFRAGLARPFRPFDPERGGALPLRVAPVAVMDSTLFDYLRLGAADAAATARAVLA